jgi:hypothetical protein
MSAKRRTNEMTKQILMIGDLTGCPIELIFLMTSNICDFSMTDTSDTID